MIQDYPSHPSLSLLNQVFHLLYFISSSKRQEQMIMLLSYILYIDHSCIYIFLSKSKKRNFIVLSYGSIGYVLCFFICFYLRLYRLFNFSFVWFPILYAIVLDYPILDLYFDFIHNIEITFRALRVFNTGIYRNSEYQH